jgi:hypothetical protein
MRNHVVKSRRNLLELFTLLLPWLHQAHMCRIRTIWNLKAYPAHEKNNSSWRFLFTVASIFHEKNCRTRNFKCLPAAEQTKKAQSLLPRK